VLSASTLTWGWLAVLAVAFGVYVLCPLAIAAFLAICESNERPRYSWWSPARPSATAWGRGRRHLTG
jgi:hypothetical protein